MDRLGNARHTRSKEIERRARGWRLLHAAASLSDLLSQLGHEGCILQRHHLRGKCLVREDLGAHHEEQTTVDYSEACLDSLPDASVGASGLGIA
jgi:hypothetical protein